MSQGVVDVVRQDGWAEVVLDRPARRNAITGPLARELAGTFETLRDDDGVAVVLLRGAEGAFCSGLDLKELEADPRPDWVPQFAAIWRSTHRALFEFPKPVVGALEAFAINGGAALALACDLLIVGESAYLEIGEAARGMPAPYNLAWLTLRHTEAVAAQLTLLGQRAAGPELTRLGIAQRCVADDDVVAEARSLCGRLAGYPQGALTRMNHGLRARLDLDADTWFDRFANSA